MSGIVIIILILCASVHISVYISGHMNKASVHKRRPFTNLLSKNIVSLEMSNDVGKTSRVIYFKLFFVSFFQRHAPTFSTNPDSVCMLWPKPLPHIRFEYWAISAKVFEISPCSKESKHFAVWPSVDAYITHVFSTFPTLRVEYKTGTFKTSVHFPHTHTLLF
jgi:hypothetical protein